MTIFEPIQPEPAPDAQVWRYSPLWALLWAIEHRALHLTLLEELRRKHDPFEASVPKRIKDDDMVVCGSRSQFTDSYFFDDMAPAPVPSEDNLTRLGRLRKGLLRSAHASSWRLGYESAPMWKLYCGVTDGVAIRSTFGELRNSVGGDPDTVVSAVKYCDYQTERFTIHTQNYHPALHKQRVFSMEEEVRVLRYREEDFNRAAADSAFALPPNWSLKWNPEDVIHRIVINPYCPPPYLPTAKAAIGRLSPVLADKVSPSDLSSDPLY